MSDPWPSEQWTSEKHHALRADFVEMLRTTHGGRLYPLEVVTNANRLVHLVVLHGLLPELDG